MSEPRKRYKRCCRSGEVEVYYPDAIAAASRDTTPIYDALAAEHARDDAPSPSSRLALLAGGLLLLAVVVLLVLSAVS